MKELIDNLILVIQSVKKSSLSIVVKLISGFILGGIIGILCLLVSSCTFKAKDIDLCVANPKSFYCQQSSIV